MLFFLWLVWNALISYQDHSYIFLHWIDIWLIKKIGFLPHCLCTGKWYHYLLTPCAAQPQVQRLCSWLNLYSRACFFLNYWLVLICSFFFTFLQVEKISRLFWGGVQLIWIQKFKTSIFEFWIFEFLNLNEMEAFWASFTSTKLLHFLSHSMNDGASRWDSSSLRFSTVYKL